MILHLISDEKFIDHVIDMFESVDPNGHIYLLPSDCQELVHIKNENAIVWGKLESRRVTEILENSETYDAVIIHNLIDDYKKHILENNLRNKKIHLMFWGAELYSIPEISCKTILPYTRQLIANTKRPIVFYQILVYLLNNSPLFFKLYQVLKNKGNNVENLSIYNKITSYSTVSPNERILVDKYINKNLVYKPFKYANIEDIVLSGNMDICNQDDFLIGNSATSTNNHLDAFKIIKKGAYSEVNFHVPLSYGDSEYAELINRCGNAFFGDNFIGINNFMTISQYNNILTKCGYVVMNHIRQQALGTILIALCKGARVFLNPQNPLYTYLIQNNILVFKVGDLRKNKKYPKYFDLASHNTPLLYSLYGKDIVKREVNDLVHWLKS